MGKIHFIVGRGRFALPKAHKSHIKHELDAQLSTSSLLTFSFGIFQMLFVIYILLFLFHDTNI
jgi:hypothetical protein